MFLNLGKKWKTRLGRMFSRIVSAYESSSLLTNEMRAIIEELCSPNWSLFRKVKAVGKWLVTAEEGGVKQATCV